MPADSQIIVPPSFLALYVPEGAFRPRASQAEITARYEFCEALASMLVERARELELSLGVTQDDVLERIGAGLAQPQAGVAEAEAGWIVQRLRELLEWAGSVRRG